MSLMKIKIRFPKLLLKSMRKRKPGYNETNNVNNRNKERSWFKPKNLLSKHIGLVLSHYRTNKTSEKTLNPSQEGNHDKLDHAAKELLEEQEIQTMKHLPFAPADQEIRGDGRNSSHKSVDHGKRSRFSDLFNKKIYKKTRFSLKWRTSRTKNVNVDEGKGIDSTSIGCDATRSANLSGKQGSPEHLARVPSRRCGGHRNDKNTKFMQQKLVQQGEESESSEEQESKETELCKKKILMGGKCRPLNKSGTLQYDQNGILLPEET